MDDGARPVEWAAGMCRLRDIGDDAPRRRGRQRAEPATLGGPGGGGLLRPPGLHGMATRMWRQVKEEDIHVMKFFESISHRGGRVGLSAIAAAGTSRREIAQHHD
jgi:hypothetical protein